MDWLIGLTLEVGWFPPPFIITSQYPPTMYATPEPDNSFDKYDEPRLHMERLMKAKLVEFDLSLRILIPLESAGIRTLGDLVKQSPKSLRKIHQLGKISIETLERFIDYHGLAWAK